jgi:hypothetical protein
VVLKAFYTTLQNLPRVPVPVIKVGLSEEDGRLQLLVLSVRMAYL